MAAPAWHSRLLPKRWGRLLLAFAILLVPASPVSALDKPPPPEFVARSWDGGDGLPDAKIQAVAQTGDGFWWLGTSGGLVRFDGVRCVVFTTNNSPELPDHRISSLLVGRSGDLWIGTEGGFLLRRGGTVLEPVLLGGRGNGRQINSLVEDHDNALWIGTQGAGVARWRHDACDWFDTMDGAASTNLNVTQIVTDRQGQLWAVANEQLAVFEKGGWKIASGAAASGQRQVVRLAPSQEGGLWIATSSPRQGSRASETKLFKLDRDGWSEPRTTYSWGFGPAQLVEDQSGRLWLSLVQGWLYLDTGGPRLASLKRSTGTLFPQCSSLVECQEGMVLGGTTNLTLLATIPQRPVTSLSLPAEARNNMVLTACVRRDGSVWLGTDGKGAYCYRQGEISQGDFGQAPNNFQQYAAAIYEDRRTNLWLGTGAGLYRFNNGQFQRVSDPEDRTIAQALSREVRVLYEDDRSNLWVGTGAGIVRLGPDGGKVFGQAEGVDGFYIRAIEEDPSGQIWAAITGRGLYKKNGERFERCGAGLWSGENFIRGLHADADGALWITTERKGLARFKDGRFSEWTKADGLPTDNLIAVLEDGKANLWFSTLNGIFGCPKSRLLSYQPGVSPPLLFWQLSATDGLETSRGSGAGQLSAGRLPDGRLWFGNWNALALFDPALFQRRAALRTRPPLVDEIFVDGIRQLPAADGALRVKSTARSFEFHYTSPAFLFPERLRFRYRLAGLDADWVDAGSRRVVNYTHLPVGKYAFQVEAGGPDGLWQSTPQALQIEIVPRFFERRLVQALGLVLLLGTMTAAGWLVARSRMRRRLLQLESRQALERERQRIAQNLHDDIGADVTQLILLGEMADRESVSDAEARRQLQRMTEKSRALVQALDETIWALNPRNDSLAGLAGYLQHYATEFLESAHIHCRAEVPANLSDVRIEVPVRHNLLLAVKEALHNVVAHSGAQEAWLRFQCINRILTIGIEDNGRGFDPAQLDGVRNGLENMRARLEGMGGTCTVESRPGSGCRVRFCLSLEAPSKIAVLETPVVAQGAAGGTEASPRSTKT